MVWFKVDDDLTFHPRVTRAGNAAMGLWLRAGTYCSAHLTDGWLSHEEARTMGSAAEIKKLVAVGLWYQDDRDEKGYQFHRWAEDHKGQKRQPTRAEVEEQRLKDRARKASSGRKGAAARWEPRLVPAGIPSDSDGIPVGFPSDSGRIPPGTPSESDGVPMAPDPTRPDPTPDETSDEVSPRAGRAASVRVTVGEFNRWWDVYPRHQAKDAAMLAYKRARQRGASTEDLLAGATRYAADPNRAPRFTAHATTWLNQGRWSDDPLPDELVATTTKPDPDAWMNR